jgi:hypothetical protein
MLNTGPGAHTLGTVSIPRLGSVGLKLMPKPNPSLYISAVLIWLPGELISNFRTWQSNYHTPEADPGR